MKFYGNKTGLFYAIANLALLYVIFISLIIFSIFFFPRAKDKIIAVLLFCAVIVLLSIFSIPVLLLQGSSIVFEDNFVKCVFFKRVRRTMAYCEIKDYGTFWRGREKFIYISRFRLNEIQRNAEVFKLYSKTNDVLVLQYSDDVIKYIKMKCPDIYETV